MPGTYLLQSGGTNQYFWNLRAPNNEKILTSEMYNSKAAALNGIASCRLNSPVDTRYRRFDDRNGSPRFSLYAANGEIIGGQ